jgi:prephenate dehydrogenase
VSSAAVVGTGLIGGSLGLALRRAGWEVVGFDLDAARAAAALDLGVCDRTAGTLEDAVRGADVVIAAVPVSAAATVVIAALDAGVPVVTDVGSAKADLVRGVGAARPEASSRFVGGHPMAGSEQDGLDGADGSLFAGATWVLTPTERTDPGAFAAVRSLVSEVGAEILAVSPEDHDALVAVVSHVPQLAASTLMDVAAQRGEEHATLLRLAAGGFRDMTRIAASHPAIWPDICVANQEAITTALDQYIAALTQVRDQVASADRPGLLTLFERARIARRNLPRGAPPTSALVELRIPVPDRPGVLAEVTTLAGSLGVNIADVEIAHSVEGPGGVLVLVVAIEGAPALEAGLTERGYHHTRVALA